MNQDKLDHKDILNIGGIFKVRYWMLVIVILLLASFLRLYHLTSDPPSPYWEEVALGYDAYSIALTGKDHHSNPYPILAFPSYGDYKPSGYFYAIVPFVKLFGLNLLAVRLPSALAGIFSVLLLYLIGAELYSKKFGLIVSLLYAIQPWSLQFSRAGFEVNLATMLVILGAYFLVRSRKQPLWLPCGVISFGLSMYTYHAARLFAPLMGLLVGIFLLTVWFRSKRVKKKHVIISFALSLFLAIAMVLPFVLNLHNPAVDSRYSQTTVFSNPAPVLESNKQIALHGNTRIAKLLYHRYWYMAGEVISGYISFFNPTFLFEKGDGNLRHSVVLFGLLYPVEALTILTGLLFIVVRKDKVALFAIVWILVATIAPSLVTPTPHGLRFLLASPAFAFLSAYGVWELVEMKKSWLRIAVFILVVVFVISCSMYVNYYHTRYPVAAQGDWQYGYQQLYAALSHFKKPGEQVYVTREQGRPSMYYLFYTSYNPVALQKIEPTLPKDQLELLQVGDYHFVDGLPPGKGIFATSLKKVPAHVDILTNIRGLDTSIIWVVWRR